MSQSKWVSIFFRPQPNASNIIISDRGFKSEIWSRSFDDDDVVEKNINFRKQNSIDKSLN